MEKLVEEALTLFNEKRYHELIILLNGHENMENGIIQYIIGSLYNQGIEREVDYSKAFEHFYKSALAGYPEGERALGIYYYQGYGTIVDEAQGLYWVKKAVDDGLVRALCTLAHIYMNGMGVPRDEYQAYLLYKEAAEKGDEHAKEHLKECIEKGFDKLK